MGGAHANAAFKVRPVQQAVGVPRDEANGGDAARGDEEQEKDESSPTTFVLSAS